MNNAHRDHFRGRNARLIAPKPAKEISLSPPLIRKCRKEQLLKTVTPPIKTAFDIRRCFFRIFYKNEGYTDRLFALRPRTGPI